MSRAALALGAVAVVVALIAAAALGLFNAGGDAARKDVALDQARIEIGASGVVTETAKHAANEAGAHGERRLELQRETEDARREIEALGDQSMVRPDVALAFICRLQRLRREPIDARCPEQPDSADPG